MKTNQIKFNLKLCAFLLLATTFIAGCKKDEVAPVDNVTFANIQVNSNQEVPTNLSSATGTTNITYEKNSNTLTYTINYSGVTPTAMHFHKGAVGLPGPVALEVKAPYTSGMTGTLTLTDAQETDLLAGLWYLNIHSAAFTGGEIRGQVVAENFMVISNVVLNSRQEFPQNPSTATGSFNGLFDKTSKKITYSVVINGFTPTMLHLHTNEVGANGPVTITLSAAGGTTDALNATQEADLLAGRLYVNVHSATYPNGEIRGQIATLNQVIYAVAASGAQEVPAVTSAATGSVYAVYNRTTKALVYTINFTGVVPRATGGMHFHKGAVGANGGVESGIAGPYTTGMKGTTPALTPAQEVDLFGGLWYFNLHSDLFPNGEIRGQLAR